MKKNQKPCRSLFTFLMVLSLLGPGILSAQEKNNSTIPPEAHEKAVQSLKLLGPDRGAREITYREVQILGATKTVSTAGTAIKATLQDLSAKETQTEIQIKLSGDILFDFDKWDIRPEALSTLHTVGSVIKAYSSREVIISGHTDSKGSETYNRNLSEKRAESVALWLQKNEDISGDILKIFGYGKSQPVAPNTNPDGSDCPEGRRKNRRVEIIVKKN